MAKVEPTNPKELIESMAQSVHLVALTVVDGPHNISDQKSVIYVQPASGEPRMRIEVTQ
jgi:hypothetical protein